MLRAEAAVQTNSEPFLSVSKGAFAMTEATYNKAVLRQYVVALQAQDEHMISRFFAEDATWTLRGGDLPISGTWSGRDRIMSEFFAVAMANYQPGSITIEVTAITAEDDRVVLQWTSRALTANGRPYENGCIGVFTMRDGKIQEVREYMDTLYLRDAISDLTAVAA
jgi:hypothetical protein